jgi:hypothetical protein
MRSAAWYRARGGVLHAAREYADTAGDPYECSTTTVGRRAERKLFDAIRVWEEAGEGPDPHDDPDADLRQLRGLLLAEHWDDDTGMLEIAGKVAALHARLTAHVTKHGPPAEWRTPCYK